MFRRLFLSILVATCSVPLRADSPEISPAQNDPAGWMVHNVKSEYQSGTTHIRVLLPPDLKPEERLPVIYLLPVEAGSESKYGDSLSEVIRLGLQTQYRVLFVAPTFSHLPWYADHPTDPLIRQESYLLKVVLPFVEQNYHGQSSPQGRLLLGFSKSGWGAWSLLLRHPDTFGAAVAWDAPLLMNWPSKYGSQPIFETDENFQNYRIENLLRRQADKLKPHPRLILIGYGGDGTGGFRQEHLDTHALLEQLAIPHHFSDGPERKHNWNSGWLPEAIPLLLNSAKEARNSP